METAYRPEPRHELPAELAAAIKAHRLRRGLGLRPAARAIGIGHGYLALLEHGERCPSIDVAQDLAEALKLPPDLTAWLFKVARPEAGRAVRRLRAQGAWNHPH